MHIVNFVASLAYQQQRKQNERKQCNDDFDRVHSEVLLSDSPSLTSSSSMIASIDSTCNPPDSQQVDDEVKSYVGHWLEQGMNLGLLLIRPNVLVWPNLLAKGSPQYPLKMSMK